MAKKKKEVETPKEPVKNAAFYKKIAEEIAQANEALEARIERALEDKEYWFQTADKAHKEQEEMLKAVTQLTENAINNLIDTQVTTDEITPLDVIYNVSMINRVIQAKFNPETTEE